MATMQYDVWSVKVGSDADFYVVENTTPGRCPCLSHLLILSPDETATATKSPLRLPVMKRG
jgi:hypothetical protein